MTHQDVQKTGKSAGIRFLKTSGAIALSSIKLLHKSQKAINENIKENLALMISLATALGGMLAYQVQLESASIQAQATERAAEIQANAAKEVARIGNLTSSTPDAVEMSPEGYMDEINSLIALTRNSHLNFSSGETISTLLKSYSFAALRNLEGRDKGTFVRFLAENELIKAEQPNVSLTGADFSNIDLKDAWLPDINLQRVYILKGSLVNTNLTRANLKGAVLKGTDLTGAVLTDADFTYADLTNVTLDIDKAIREGATFCNATMPDGTKGDC
jgi:hypothetical protein